MKKISFIASSLLLISSSLIAVGNELLTCTNVTTGTFGGPEAIVYSDCIGDYQNMGGAPSLGVAGLYNYNSLVRASIVKYGISNYTFDENNKIYVGSGNMIIRIEEESCGVSWPDNTNGSVSKSFKANTTFCGYFGLNNGDGSYTLGITIQGTTGTTKNEPFTDYVAKYKFFNALPTATSLSLTNTPTSANKNDILTLNYTYDDAESDVETTSTFKWYKADDSSGTNKLAISGATSNTYTVTSSEEKKYIGFSVTPVNAVNSGTETFLSPFILVNDTTAPTLSSSTPSNGAIDIAIGGEFVIDLTFNENIALGSSGTIKIVDDTDDSTSVTIDVTSHNAQLSVSTTTLTINPTNPLSENKTYHIEISAGAITDTESTPNTFAGISDNSVLSFKTTDTIAPTLLSSTPTDDSTTFNHSSDIVLTFSEDVKVKVGAGGDTNIVIYDGNTNIAYTTIDLTNTNIVTFNSNTVTINQTNNPANILNFDTDYYIQIDTGAITDISTNANAYAGISDTTTLNFKTAGPTVDLSSVVTAGKWNMVAVPSGLNVNTSDVSGATIWTYNNSTPAWEQPTTLTPSKGYWLYTTATTGYDSIPASVILSRGLREVTNHDYEAIKSGYKKPWTLVGISYTTDGISWSDIYNQDNTLNEWCSYNHIFYYDSANDSWNTTSKVPYLGAVWVKQIDCED